MSRSDCLDRRGTNVDLAYALTAWVTIGLHPSCEHGTDSGYLIFYDESEETMPFFIFRGTDGPNRASIRTASREAHRAYIRVPTADCRVIAGGPLVNDSGDDMFGTMLVLEAADRYAAQRFLQDDPYAKAKLFTRTELDRWQWGLGDLII